MLREQILHGMNGRKKLTAGAYTLGIASIKGGMVSYERKPSRQLRIKRAE